MKIKVLIIILALNFSAFGQEKPQIKITFSEIYATYSFVKQLSNYYPDSEYKKIYQISKYNIEKYNKLIEQLDTLKLSETIDFSEYPKGQKLPLMTTNIISKNLISSKTLVEFKTRMFGIIPSSELFALTNIIAKFQPIYNSLIYNPNKEKFDNKVSELSEFVQNEKFEEYFKTGLSFYNTKWDNSVIFEIIVIPSLNKNGFTATAFMNNAVSEIQIGFKEYDILFSVLMHEIYHILYNEETLEFKKTIDKWFKNNHSNNSQYAHLLLNEVLATALGNGYVYQQINNELDKYDWYNNKYINLMAKKIYPTLKKYIDNNKSIDKTFIDTYISIYDTNFPEWIYELDNILTYRYIIADSSDDFDYFLSNYPRTSFAYMEDRIDVISIQKMKETPITKIIIITNDNSKKLKLLKKTFPELENWKCKSKNDFIYISNLDDKTKLIIVNSIKNNPKNMLNKKFDNRKIN
jgi:hypothetical protein